MLISEAAGSLDLQLLCVQRYHKVLVTWRQNQCCLEVEHIKICPNCGGVIKEIKMVLWQDNNLLLQLLLREDEPLHYVIHLLQSQLGMEHSNIIWVGAHHPLQGSIQVQQHITENLEERQTDITLLKTFQTGLQTTGPSVNTGLFLTGLQINGPLILVAFAFSPRQVWQLLCKLLIESMCLTSKIKPKSYRIEKARKQRNLLFANDMLR